jgi:hypothetical protein
MSESRLLIADFARAIMVISRRCVGDDVDLRVDLDGPPVGKAAEVLDQHRERLQPVVQPDFSGPAIFAKLDLTRGLGETVRQGVDSLERPSGSKYSDIVAVAMRWTRTTARASRMSGYSSASTVSSRTRCRTSGGLRRRWPLLGSG